MTKKTRRPRHASLSRPYGELVDELPEGVIVQVARTPWQRICDTLVDNRGQWFRLEQTYKGSSTSAVTSARKTLESEYTSEEAAALSVASRLIDEEGDRYEVFLRVDAPEDEQADLFDDDDE